MSGSHYIWLFSVGISLMMTSGTLAGILLQNVALNKIAVQSSVNGNLGTPDKAVDGNRNPSYQSGSCTLSRNESNPWWRVDLQAAYQITAITITNRDQLPDTLNGSEIWIGNSVNANDPPNVRCVIISHIPSGSTYYFSCDPIKGRYITVRLPGSGKVLSLCEVQVFPTLDGNSLPNVALKGDATQSSTLSFAGAFKAIDGRRDSFYNQGFCSHTAEDESNPWWRVDLQQSYVVTSVKITNRGDCCAERLDGAEIRIGNSLENNGNNNPRCASIIHIQAGKTGTYYCDGGSMEGRFVNVIIPGNAKTLTLCEVEVYAAPAVDSLANVALNRQAQQSSTYDYYYSIAAHAVSGCTTRNYLDRCCASTVGQVSPWWTVDLLAVYKVSAVIVLNRNDCCPERISGAEVLIGNSLQYSTNPRCGEISSVEATYTFQCGEMKGRYVTVIIPEANRMLTPCGVEVYASLDKVPEVVRSSPPSPPPPSPPPPAVTMSMVLSDRNVMVVGERLCWSDALLYCRSYHWDLLSLRSQKEQSEVEQLLSGSPFPITDYLWLGLRRDIMGDEWFWMSGDSMTFTKWVLDSAPDNHASPCGGMASGEHLLWDDQPCETRFNFICQSGAENITQTVYFYSTYSTT